MTDRERWIVYPLIFLTLGIALRNQFLPTRRFGAVDLRAGEITAQKITCNDLFIQEKGECNQLQCRQFQFNEALGKHLRTLGLAECAQLNAGETKLGRLLVVDSEGKPVVLAGTDKNSGCGVIQTMNPTVNPNGMPQVQLRSTDTGGIVTTVGLDGNVLMVMGEEGQNIGVFAHFPQIGQTIPLTPPLRIEPKSNAPKPTPTPTPVVPQQPANPSTGGKKP
jgi:hypothetical protein